MTDFYDNLLKATNNIDDITTEKYGVITKLDGLYCSVKETDNDLEHNNVPIINGANLSVGDKVIIGFLNNSIYAVVCYGALDKTIHDDSKQDTLISGTHIKTINHQSLLGSGNITIEGGGTGVDIVTSWSNPTTDTSVPSEKLTKDTLDLKLDSSDAFSGDYEDLNNKPTIPSKITDLTNDSNFIEKSSTNGLVKNDGTIDTTNYSTFDGNYNSLTNKPTIPSKTSDLTNDGDGTNVFVKNNDSRLTDARTPSSHSHGNITNDGKIGTNANYFVYTTTGGAVTSKQKIGNINYLGRIGSTANLPLITTTNGTIATGSFGSSANTFCEGNDSRLSDARTPISHTHTKSEITDFPTIPSKTSDLTNDSDFITSSSLPTKTSDLTNDGDGTNPFLTQHQSLANYVQKSSTSGLLKNDGTIDTSTYLTSSALSNYVQKSSTNGLLKNDGTVDTTSYSTFSGSYNDLSNKPSIPSSSSDLSDGSDLVKKSATSGLLKNDGSVDTNSYLTSSSLSNYVQKSSTTGLLKNDGTVDTSAYITSSAISGKEDTSNKVTSWSSTVNDTHYPTEKLVKDSLDSKQATLISGTNIKTINNTSLLGSGNISVGGGGGSSNLFDLNTVSQYGDNAIEEGVDRDGNGLGYGSDFLIYNSQDQKFYYDKDGSADNDTGNELATMNDIPSLTNYVQKSDTNGLIKNDGSIDTNTYLTQHQDVSTWTSQTIATYGTLYVNTALRLCEFRYNRASYNFSSTAQVTLHSAVIPSTYRPKYTYYLASWDNQVSMAVTEGGNIIAYTSSKATRNIFATGMWHY